MVKRTSHDIEQYRRKLAERGDCSAAHAEIQQLIEPIKVSHLNPSALTASPRSARRHSERQVAQIAASMQEFGCIVPIITDEQGIVLADVPISPALDLLETTPARRWLSPRHLRGEQIQQLHYFRRGGV